MKKIKLHIPCRNGGYCNVHFDHLNVSGGSGVSRILADKDAELPVEVWCGKHRGQLSVRGIRILQSYFGLQWPAHE